MKNTCRFASTALILLLSAFSVFGQGSPNVPLLANINDYPSQGYNDCWGYTAPDGREYGLLGVRNGLSIIDITDPANAAEVAFFPGNSSSWRDIKTYQQYAYVVNESGGGMQIIDMSNLPASATLANTYTDFSTSHNIYIDVPAGILYAEGNSIEPVRVLSLADPVNPVEISTFGIECHDIYAQNGVAYISEGTRGTFGVYDVSNPAAPVRTGTVTVPNAGYAHNAWATADGRYLMTTEETTNRTVKLWDLQDLGNISMTDEYLGPTNLAHNTHIKGDFAYISHYADGLRIVDISDPNNIFEAGFYDTFPGAGGGFVGDWGAFPFFDSGKVLVSDISTGLYVVFFDDGTLGGPPAITSTPNLNGTVGQPYAYDADNTVDVTGTAPITFSYTGPTGFSVDANTGVVTWTPTAGQVGANAVSITATNSEGSDTQNFTVTVVEPPPFAARINAGGADYTDSNGDLFEADQAYTAGSFGFVGGVTNTFGNAIGGTTDDVLYQSLRRPGTASSVTYRFDVPASGSYDVTLHMTAPGVGTGNFIMDVLAEGGLVFDDLDINTQSGGTYQALVVSFTASVTDGTLDLDFVTVNRQALIGAIAVEESSGPPTPQDISVSPLALDFGQVETGQTADLVTTITNDGGTVLNVTGLTLSGGDFSLVSPPGTPFQVAANGGSVALTVRFGPGSTGAQSETLDIDSDDPDEATVTVTLDGEGTDPPAGEEFRINAGGADYTDTNGDLFEADQAYTAGSFGFVGGVSSSFPNPIGGTTDDLLYQSLRRSGESSSFSYQFDVSSSATFDVTLYLTAPAIGPGSFVLDVVAEGATVLNDLDVNAASGGTYQALTQTFSVSVTDGTLNLDFVDVNKASVVSAIAVVEQTAGPESISPPGQGGRTAALTPRSFVLRQNYPNPFNPETRIPFDLAASSHVRLTIFDALGREVRVLVESTMRAGSHAVKWNGRDGSGLRVNSGVYIYRLDVDGETRSGRMLLLQ